MTCDPLLFVYGTLRPAFDGPMALWLREVAIHVGPAVARGSLYRVVDYPAFVPDGEGRVTGDLFALSDPAAILAVLDAYEECGDDFPAPHEYRRERLTVRAPESLVDAWTYIYVRDVSGLPRIDGGDFLL